VNTNVGASLLAGTRVIDLTMHLSGPYGAMLLADMGCEVIKVEPPTGDHTRAIHPMKGGMSLHFASINRNKRSVVIDLKNENGRNVLLDLLSNADVVFNNFRPDVMERLGLDYQTLRALNPGLVYCSLTGYGKDGPRRLTPAYDLAIQALSGGMSLTGYEGQLPARAGIPIADLCGGTFAAMSILAALVRRAKSGEGCEVETSLLDTQISFLMYWAAFALNSEVLPGPQGGGNSTIMPYGAVKASDGYLVIAVWGEQFWPKLCDAIGRPELVSDHRFLKNHERVQNRAELQAIIDLEFAKHTVDEWLAILHEADVPSNRINNVREAMSDPQVVARDLSMELMIGDAMCSFAGNPIKQVPRVEMSLSPPPRLGQHTAEVLREWLAYDDEIIDKLLAEGAISQPAIA
jgi:crotonobetainyl-CoA:carnitine CoA-transferase CaiB-like acyl-CoA transferase